MSIEEMRALLGLGPEVPDEDVVAAYAAYVGGSSPAIEPVSLSLAKLHLRVETDDENELIEQAIVAAREWVEAQTGHLLVRRQVTETFGIGSDIVELRAWPVASIDVITYSAASGLIPLIEGSYTLAPLQRPAQIGFLGSPFAGIRPGVGIRSPIAVTATVGYANGQAPAPLVRAMLVLIAAYHENRGGLPADAVASAKLHCNSFKRHRL